MFGDCSDNIFCKKYGKCLTKEERAKIKIKNEIFSSQKSINAIRTSDGVIFLIDGKESITDQDLHLLSLIISSGKPLVIGINKSESLSAYEKSNLKRNINKK